jgi:hypothetical protein
MAEIGERLQAVLDGCPKFLYGKDLAIAGHQPCFTEPILGDD